MYMIRCLLKDTRGLEVWLKQYSTCVASTKPTPTKKSDLRNIQYLVRGVASKNKSQLEVRAGKIW
jgi:hypothetical protein